MNRRGLILALIVSLAANALLVGVWAGDHWWGQPRAMHEAGMGRLLDTVPEQARPAVRAELRRHRMELIRALRDVRRARMKVHTLIEAGVETPAQVDALAEALQHLRQVSGRVQRLLHRAILDGVSADAVQKVGDPGLDEAEEVPGANP